MNRDQEHRRVAETYGRYGASSRRRRSWSETNPGNAAIRRELTQAADAISELEQAKELLDIGCGSGWWLAHLAARGDVAARLHGVDILPERIEAARTRVPSARLELADAHALPYDAESFDVVTLFTTLSSHASPEDASAVLREAARVLAPAGAIVIWEPRLPNPFNPRTILIGRRLLATALPSFEPEFRTLTLLPPLARRLGRRTERLYPMLAGVPALRSHRLTVLRRRGPATAPRR